MIGAVSALTFAAIAGNDDGPKIFFSGPGTLGIGPQGCLAFHADNELIFILQNDEGFGPGDRVFVEGVVDDDVMLCFPSPIPAIVDNTIQRFFEGCGELTIAPQGCIGFATDGGENFFVQDTGGFSVGARVFITGPVNEESLVCFPIVSDAIEMNTIEPCVPGDVNADGTVDVVDLVEVIQQWGACQGFPFPFHADLNGDEVVNVTDLVLVIRNWTA
jgi:hypothetical protein